MTAGERYELAVYAAEAERLRLLVKELADQAMPYDTPLECERIMAKYRVVEMEYTETAIALEKLKKYLTQKANRYDN